jgi:hypothetical protein
LLSVRYGAWTDELHPENAANWARYWRPEIQGYMFGYRAATGVDLAAVTVTGQVNATVPSVLLRSRLPKQVSAGGARTPRQVPAGGARMSRQLPAGGARTQRQLPAGGARPRTTT